MWIAKQNEKKVYNILFKAGAETLEELAEDKKYLGAEIGFMEVLHTWGQTLVYHSHIHVIVPAGGIAKMYNKEWITYCKPPFENANIVIKYLGRYTHRVAISNSRIIKEEKGKTKENARR